LASGGSPTHPAAGQDAGRGEQTGVQRTSRSRSITQHVLVQLLVARHDAVGRDSSARRAAASRIRACRSPSRNTRRPERSWLDIPLRREEARLAMDDHLGRPPTALARTGTATPSPRARRDERPRSGGQQEAIATPQDLGHVATLPRRDSVAARGDRPPAPPRRAPGVSRARSVAGSCGARREDANDVRHRDGAEVRNVAKTFGPAVRASGGKCRRWAVILGRRDEVGDDDDVAAGNTNAR